MRIKIGNSVILRILVKDQDGATVTDLATADEIYFMVKTNLVDADNIAKITKKMTDGGILVDDPSTGYLKISLTSADTLITPNFYYPLVEIKYSSTNKNEINLQENSVDFNKVEFYQDGIRGS